MDPDDDVCLCFHVSLRKISNFIERERPRVASQISECLGAGTGCQWCVPFLRRLHAMHARGEPMDLPVSPEEYARRRSRYRASGQRDADGVERPQGRDGSSEPGSSSNAPIERSEGS